MSSTRPYSHLRASDAERERVVAFLREHALAGRLSDDELEDRIGAAYGAVTVGDLERLIADLPRRQSAPMPRSHRAPSRRRQPTGPLIAAGVLLLLFTGLPMVAFAGVVALLAVVFAVSFVLGPFLLVGLIIALSTRRRRPPPSMRWGRCY